jgi:branched-chain amino acid transport system substrate-binding protein
MTMLMQRRPWWLVATLIVMFLFVAACNDDNDSDGGETEEPDATEADGGDETPEEAAEIITPEDVLTKDPNVTNTEELNWGGMFEESGPPQAVGFGIPTGDGVKMAVQEINEAGGFQVGDTVYTINLIEKDTRSDIPNTIAVTQELIQDDGVKVIWGPATIGEPEATQVTQAAEVLHLCPCQQREQTSLTSSEQAHGESRWAFQTLLPFSLLIENAARNFVRDYPDFDSMALICQNSTTGQDICERTKTAYEGQGIEVIGDIQYFPAGTTDYNPFLTNIRTAGDPDYLFNYDEPVNTTQIVRQALQLGIGRLHLVTVPASLAESLIGVELTVPVSAGAAPRQETQPLTPEVADYFDRYETFKGELPVPAFPSLMMYDYVYMVAAAMQKAGTVDDTTAISEALETIHYNGVAEEDLFFNSRHMAVHGTEPCYVQTGQPLVCEHVPAPPEAAE